MMMMILSTLGDSTSRRSSGAFGPAAVGLGGGNGNGNGKSGMASTDEAAVLIKDEDENAENRRGSNGKVHNANCTVS